MSCSFCLCILLLVQLTKVFRSWWFCTTEQEHSQNSRAFLKELTPSRSFVLWAWAGLSRKTNHVTFNFDHQSIVISAGTVGDCSRISENGECSDIVDKPPVFHTHTHTHTLLIHLYTHLHAIHTHPSPFTPIYTPHTHTDSFHLNSESSRQDSSGQVVHAL